MKRLLKHRSLLLTSGIAAAMLLYGPMIQPAHYHDFADQRMLFGLPHGLDVLSNAGFIVIGLWGLLRLWPTQRQPSFISSWPAYRLFLSALILTGFGSGFYHWAPDNIRLVWDRLPIALACAALLAAVHADTHPQSRHKRNLPLLAMAAPVSLIWWIVTGENGSGDLRPYLFLQILPLILIPLWQNIYPTPYQDKLAFGIAIGLYVAAKAAEIYDHEILGILGCISGHTLKHLLATLAAWVIIRRLMIKKALITE